MVLERRSWRHDRSGWRWRAGTTTGRWPPHGCCRATTDPISLVAIADLMLAGRGYEVVGGDEALVGLAAWVAHRRRRMEVRSAVKNHGVALPTGRCTAPWA
jgi:hypothetical protein